MPTVISRMMSRPPLEYRSQNARFMIECDFSQQYHLYYRKKLDKARPLLEANCRQKWDPKIPICNLSEVSSRDSDSCIVIGTIFKRMKSQPNVIDELSKGNFDISSESYTGHYTCPDDTLTLEDDEESVQLTGKIDPNMYVTGVTAALLGSPTNDGGRFCVEDICFASPGYRASAARAHVGQSNSEPSYLLIVSGLGFKHEMEKSDRLTKALQNLIDFLWGVGKFSDDEKSSRVSRVLVVGNSLQNDKYSATDNVVSKGSPNGGAAPKVKSHTDFLKEVENMDQFFAQISKTINIDVMPGRTDPCSQLMPQQPLHPCIFPKSSVFPTFNCTTNPHCAIYNDVGVLAVSGQNVDVISKFSGIDDPLEIMKCQLRWGNIAPSAPDNLFSMPYKDEDPFNIDVRPDIYIVGNQDSYKVESYVNDASENGQTRTLLVTVPEFWKTFSCVLFDLVGRRSQLLSFE